MSKRDADQLVKDLRRYFAAHGLDYTVDKAQGGHWFVFNPEGKRISAGIESTPSDRRFRANAIARLRRRGIVGGDFR